MGKCFYGRHSLYPHHDCGGCSEEQGCFREWMKHLEVPDKGRNPATGTETALAWVVDEEGDSNGETRI